MHVDDVAHAAAGRQGTITGGGTIATFDAGTDVGTLGALAPGTYVWRFLTPGAGAADVIIRGTHTGTVPTAQLYATKADGSTKKGAAAAFPAYAGDATDWLGSITTLRGERYTVVSVTVPASSTFTPTAMEFSAL